MAARSNPSENLSPIGALARFEPARATAEIVKAFVAAEGKAVAAAEDLGLSYRGLTRIIDRLQCGPAIDAECERLGFPRHQGRPRNPPKKRAKRG